MSAIRLDDLTAELVGQLKLAKIDSARLDVLILLEDILEKDRSYILAHPEQTLTNYQVNRLRKQTLIRKSHIPLAYIRGFSEFYGRRFRVNRHTLVPRPESEKIIELLLSLNLPHKPIIADVGAGSGCLGITAAIELSKSKVDLYDIDSGALAVARHNVHMHELNIKLHKRDLLSRPTNLYDVVLANLPYVPNGMKLNKAATHEPRLALFGGQDGLNFYRRLFLQINSYTWKPEYIITESLLSQHKTMISIAHSYGFAINKSNGLVQVFSPI